MPSSASMVCSAEHLKILANSANDLALNDYPEGIIDAICKRLSEHLGLEIYLVYLLDRDGRTLRCRFGATSEISGEYLRAGGVLCHCQTPDQPTIVVDACKQPECSGRQIFQSCGLTAYACVPMGARGTLVGRLLFGSRRRERLGDDELMLIQAVGDQISMALERSRLIAQLQQQAKLLQEADKAKDTFLATVSHDLRSPLAAILGYAHMLKKGTCDKEKAAHAVEVIINNAKAQAQLINDLLDVSRILAGKLSLDLKAIDLGAVIQAAVDTIRPTAEAKDQRLCARISPAVNFRGDPDRLQQIFWNLLSNAVKFTPRGGEIQIDLHKQPSGYRVIVIDNGIGIGAQCLPRVFERFWQGDRTVAGNTGLGLGLAIVRHLVELHGGSVTAESNGSQRGARFTVNFPVTEHT